MTIVQTPEPCIAHKNHIPEPTYCELHHVIPQAWQGTWMPVGIPATASEAGPILWDPRTVPLCPSGHRNVHFWLVKVMHSIPRALLVAGLSVKAFDEVLATAQSQVRSVAREAGHVPNPKEFAISAQAVERLYAVGGAVAVQTMIDARQWGEA